MSSELKQTSPEPRRARVGATLALSLTLLPATAALAAEPVPPVEQTPSAGQIAGAEAEEKNPLLPPGEEERMGSHPIEPGALAFKPGRGFTAKSADGDFALNLGARAQFLYSLLHENADGGTTEHSMQIRRARLALTGNMFDPNVKYKMELAVSPRDQNTTDGAVTTTSLLDFYADFAHVRDLSLRLGQYKVPFNRQRVISSGALQLVDRSIANAEFNVDRDIGLDLRSEDFLGLEALRYYLGVYPGGGRNSFQTEETWHMFYLGRVEVLPFGDFSDYVEADFERTGPRLSLGLAYAHIDDAPLNRGVLGAAAADGGSTDFDIFEADVMFKFAGLSILSEFFWRDGERNPGNTPDDDGMLTISPTRDGIGWFIQSGYLLPRMPVELALRYSMIDGKDDAGENGLTDSEEYVAGASYYFAHHQLKLQADYSRLVTDGEFGDGVDQIRAQLQLAY